MLCMISLLCVALAGAVLTPDVRVTLATPPVVEVGRPIRVDVTIENTSTLADRTVFLPIEVFDQPAAFGHHVPVDSRRYTGMSACLVWHTIEMEPWTFTDPRTSTPGPIMSITIGPRGHRVESVNIGRWPRGTYETTFIAWINGELVRSSTARVQVE